MHARRALGDGDRSQVLGHAHRLRALGNEQHGVARRRGHRRPAVVAEARLGPRAQLPARVVALAHQQVRVLERAGGGAPARVAGDHLDAAVLVLEVQLAQQRRILAVVVAPPQRVHADEAGVPAGAEDRSEHVLAVAQQRGDVVRRVLDPRAVVGPAGREDGVADARAVELQLQHAAGGRVEGRAAHAARERERPAQVRAAQQPAQQLVRRRRRSPGRPSPGRGRGRGRSTARATSRGPGAEPRRARSARTARRPRPRPGRSRRTRARAAAPGPRRRRRPSCPRRPCRCPTERRSSHAAPGRRSGACPARRRERPAQPRGGRVDAGHVLAVLAAQPDRAHSSPLQPAREALDHEALEQEEQEQHRQRREDDGCEDVAPVRHVLADELVDDDRDRLVGRAAQVDQRRQEVGSARGKPV